MDYTVKNISQSDFARLPRLFKNLYNRSPNLSEIFAKHDTEYAGARDLGRLALDPDGQAVAFYGVFPVAARIGGKSYLVAQSGDTMVHKAYQGRGLFTRLGQETYELAKKAAVVSVFGFPGLNAYPGFTKRLGWQHHENIRRYRFWVPTIPLSEMTCRFGIGCRIVRRWQEVLIRLMARGSYFEGLLMSQGFDCIVRSKQYWNYKMKQPGVYCVRSADVDVVLKLEGSLGLGDFGAADTAQFRKVLSRLKIFCFFSGIACIRTYVSPGSPQDKMLSMLAMPREGLPIGYVDFTDSVGMSSVKYCYLDMDTF